MFCYEDHVNRDVHLALVRGSSTASASPLVRVHLIDTLADLIGVRDGALRLDAARGDAAHREVGTA